ncbi:MAG: mechanosensitive ion channel family protein [Chloroflexota bacterium]|nr:mechanosensitive ion channel family protein [Chloroflexota bacterium]MDE2951021.1 mechanosensitive ion channel family protein [Chloroflexota bacterium]
MDLLAQLPFLLDQPPLVRDLALNLILVIICILIIVVLRWVLTAILFRPLRVLARRTKTEVDDELLNESLTPVRIAVVGLGIIFTVNLFQFGPEVQQIAETAGRLLIIGSVFFALIRMFEVLSLHPAFFRQVTGLTIPDRLLPFLNTVVKFLIIALGLIFILQELNYDVAALIASLGVVGIGISLASQDTLGNLFGFAAIVSDNPFKVGDFIRTPDVTGIVEQVGMRSTRIRQLDQVLVTVPNNLLTNAVVMNLTRLEKRRFDVTLTFTYSTTSGQLRAVVEAIRELLLKTEDVDPESVIAHFVDFSSSSLDVRIICQILLADWREYTALKETLLLEIMGIVEDLGISFAFPSRSIYIEDTPGAARPEQASSIDEGQLPGEDSGRAPRSDQDSPDSSPSSAP